MCSWYLFAQVSFFPLYIFFSLRREARKGTEKEEKEWHWGIRYQYAHWDMALTEVKREGGGYVVVGGVVLGQGAASAGKPQGQL